MFISGPVDVAPLDTGLKPSKRRLGDAPARPTQTEFLFRTRKCLFPTPSLASPQDVFGDEVIGESGIRVGSGTLHTRCSR
jgi:hypothetical protein